MTLKAVRGSGSPDRKTAIRQAILGGPILPTILRLALPTIVVLIAQTAVGVAETYYVSSLGTQALVGVALVFPIWMLMGMMSAGGIGGGVAAAVSRAGGVNRDEDAAALVWHSLVLAILFGAGFPGVMFLFGANLFQSLGANGSCLAAALLFSR